VDKERVNGDKVEKGNEFGSEREGEGNAVQRVEKE
tara:strand:+ start:616 stop:720 length:105 start_codon:yes stop_codon:yes gene_type:complete